MTNPQNPLQKTGHHNRFLRFVARGTELNEFGCVWIWLTLLVSTLHHADAIMPFTTASRGESLTARHTPSTTHFPIPSPLVWFRAMAGPSNHFRPLRLKIASRVSGNIGHTRRTPLDCRVKCIDGSVQATEAIAARAV